LLLALGLPGVAPLFALSLGDVESKLPACCRRNGAHHCNTQVAFHSGSETTLSSQPMHCPTFPSVVPTGLESSYVLTSVSSFQPALKATLSAGAITAGAPRKSMGLSRMTRGPPATSLL
jgi:hypothetical protein